MKEIQRIYIIKLYTIIVDKVEIVIPKSRLQQILQFDKKIIIKSTGIQTQCFQAINNFKKMTKPP